MIAERLDPEIHEEQKWLDHAADVMAARRMRAKEEAGHGFMFLTEVCIIHEYMPFSRICSSVRICVKPLFYS